MTTIIFLEHPTGVTIGYDSQVSSGPVVEQLAFPKVFANNGNVIGVAGNVSGMNILRYADLPSAEGVEWDIDRWVATVLAPAMRDAIFDANVQDGEQDSGVTILVAVRGHVYRIAEEGSLVRVESGVYAIGSGFPFALGALKAGVTLREAMDIAAHFDRGTGGRITVTQAAAILAGEVVEGKAA